MENTNIFTTKRTRKESKNTLILSTGEFRTEFERDYDRILFSTPIRRLADKTQVFPLERIDSIRTRLTHSHEVSDLARSIGICLVNDKDISKELENYNKRYERYVPAILSATGLAHDIGNPPFGHKGEKAISSWFKDNMHVLDVPDLTKSMKIDFLEFEGNAQTLRILTKLQMFDGEFGLNLTYGTLAALMKYTVPSDEVDKRKNADVAKKKFGYFQSEETTAKDIRKSIGIKKGERHPLTYIMEASDDIAYTVLDAEDAIKKKLVSFNDVIAYLLHKKIKDSTVNKPIKQVCKLASNDNKKYLKNPDLSQSEVNDMSMQQFRHYAILVMVSCVINTLKNADYRKLILSGKLKNSLLDISEASDFKKRLKSFDKENAYNSQTVLEVEIQGYKTIRHIMDYLWRAISKEKDERSPFEDYVYQRISENYRRVYKSDPDNLPKRYRQLQLVTDMVSGMTDNFAIVFLKELKMHDDTN